MKHISHHQVIATVVIALAAAMLLSACGRQHDAAPENKTVGQHVDETIARADRAASQAAAKMREAAQQAHTAAGPAAERAAEVVADSTITAKVSAALVADERLSALKIDVDTHDARVALKGTAPEQASRDRAAQIAHAIDGVASVDNQLVVEMR